MERRTAEVSVPIPDDSSYSHGSVSSGDADGSKTAKQVAENTNESRTMDELPWQIQIRERDARRKRYEKECADKNRGAKVSDIEAGDSSSDSQPK